MDSQFGGLVEKVAGLQYYSFRPFYSKKIHQSLTFLISLTSLIVRILMNIYISMGDVINRLTWTLMYWWSNWIY